MYMYISYVRTNAYFDNRWNGCILYIYIHTCTCILILMYAQMHILTTGGLDVV